ncbi:nucleotidyl transferase AbiEii/AbiGii toxin family protein [Streptomyces sp. tea 10]|nr:nucleotidyl transferase AbiEii/AbiGii toxin family protein [Streptomyces sp. tea 10]
MNVLAPERKPFEKLAAVHDAAGRNDIATLLKHGRHFYDIHRLVENAQVASALEAFDPVEKQKLIDDIDQQSVAAGFS